MKLYAFTCGWVIGPFRGEEAGDLRIPVPCYVIEHPAGTALVDTGLHPQMRDDPHARIGWVADLLRVDLPPGEDVLTRLRVDPAAFRRRARALERLIGLRHAHILWLCAVHA